MGRYPLIFLTLTFTLQVFVPQAKAQPDASLSSPVIPVWELKDVQPTDWAFSALQSLQQRYQCIEGYPDQTFRGEQVMSRYEFAALLNRCLSHDEVINREQPTIDRLQTEYARELAILRGRVDGSTARVRELEITEFSTTTKLKGVVNFVVTDSSQEGEDTGVVFQARSRLNFNTSFTGKDSLLTRLTVGNALTPNLADGTKEVTQTHQFQGNTDNQVILGKLSYKFPIGERTIAILTPVGGQHRDYNLPAINPFFEDDNAGTTTLSTFAQRNPILSLGGGSGFAVSHLINDSLQVGAGYYTPDGSNADTGLFGGSYSAGIGVKWDAGKDVSVGLNYLHGFFQEGDFGFTDGLSESSSILGTSIVNDTLSQFSTVTNAYGIEAFWRVNRKLGLGGRLGYTDVKALDEGDAAIWNYSLSLVFPNAGDKNDLGGIIIGVQPYLGRSIGNSQFSNEIPLHLEGFYKWQVSDEVSLTPGLIWHPNPNQSATEADLFTSSLRMTVTF